MGDVNKNVERNWQRKIIFRKIRIPITPPWDVKQYHEHPSNMDFPQIQPTVKTTAVQEYSGEKASNLAPAAGPDPAPLHHPSHKPLSARS